MCWLCLVVEALILSSRMDVKICLRISTCTKIFNYTSKKFPIKTMKFKTLLPLNQPQQRLQIKSVQRLSFYFDYSGCFYSKVQFMRDGNSNCGRIMYFNLINSPQNSFFYDTRKNVLWRIFLFRLLQIKKN